MYRIINADVFSGLSGLDNNSIDVAITSPPYWGQRDYGFIGQIGNEKTYNEYIGKLITIFNKLRLKLKDKGIFFLNIGDKYISKYGKSPLGMIPYKLAFFMKLDGWFLNDIIIWYKPNHMPSSIKNRFTNSYEPIFVFSKNRENIYTDYIKGKPNFSNILKINLQPLSYNHVAVYPEKLVYSLLNIVNLSNDSSILDPFAGSGTTLKVVQDLNNSLFSKSLNAIMIENSTDYIEIIKKRCTINSSKVERYNFINYSYQIPKDDNFYNFNFRVNYQFNEYISERNFLKIFNKKNEYYNLLSLLLKNRLNKSIDKDAISFIGTKEFDIELIYNTSLLNNYGWVIRNLIAVEENNRWFPLFMIVDDNKMFKYRFNYKLLSLKHKNDIQENWNRKKYIGYFVTNNLKINSLKGVIVKILELYTNGFPKYVIVKWDDNTFTREFVIYSQEEVNNNLQVHHNKKIIIKEKEELIPLEKKINFNEKNTPININIKNNYNGKFKNIKRKNWGASPGARASLEKDHFSIQRLYDVKQPLIANYLNYKRTEKNLSKKELTDLFTESYRHTVGHWLRKDFGGSIPLPEDWEKLNSILNIDNYFTNYVCKTALSLQTVKNGEHKLPEDFISIDFLNKIPLLYK